MQQGVECIYKGVPTTQELTSSAVQLYWLNSRDSRAWRLVYVPAQIELGKRPKLEYQL